MADDTNATLLGDLAARRAITDVLYRYARGCDRVDEAALRSCFHPDSTHRHGAFDGLSQDFCAFALDVVRKLKACKHLITNVMIEIDGDRAVSECHLLSYHRFVDPDGREKDRFHGGRYLDRFERRDGDWKIAHRTGLYDFERIANPAESAAGRPADSMCSTQAPGDPLYAMLASI